MNDMQGARRGPLIRVEDLRIDIHTDDGILSAVRGVDLAIAPGKALGLVGESGCGKSLTCKAILGINEKNCRTTGRIWYDEGEGALDLMTLRPNGPEIRKIRGAKISMIFQEPMTAFSPLYSIGNQIAEMIRLHVEPDKKKAWKMVLEMLKKVGIANPQKRIRQFPHEFSGGMLQRAMIAMALSCGPSLLIADEPTTALDVTIQAQILEQMRALQKEYGMAILFVTHDLGTVAGMCDEVAVMYLGEVVERGDVRSIFRDPRHPYTRGLLGSMPHMGKAKQQGKLESIEGTVPVPIQLPNRCGFFERCDRALDEGCPDRPAPLIEASPGHLVKCHLYAREGANLNG
jgi:peptide/nickel transport system ATP-binding protein